jgi:hypothetical protein
MRPVRRVPRLGLPALSFAALAVVAVPSVRAQSAVPPSAAQDHLARTLLDTIAARLSTLEIQRAFLAASGSSATHPDRQAIESQIAALRAYVRELPNPKVAEAFVNWQVIGAIEARLASVAVNQRLIVATSPNHPDAQALAAAETQLKRRRSELQALVVGTGSQPSQ